VVTNAWPINFPYVLGIATKLLGLEYHGLTDFAITNMLVPVRRFIPMNVSLTPELETLIDQKVKTGLYNSASDVLREALRLLDEHDRDKERRRGALRKEMTKGVEDINAGRYVTLETQKDFDALAEHTKQKGRERLARSKSGS